MLTIRETIDPGFLPGSGRPMVFEAKSGEESLGVCRFALSEDRVSLVSGDCGEPAVLDGLVRAGLFAAMNRGAARFCCAPEDAALTDAVRVLDIPAKGELERFFSGGCKGGCSGDCANCHG